MDDAFLVCGKNRNNQIYWPKLRQFQTKSTRNKKEKKNWPKAGGKKCFEILQCFVGAVIQVPCAWFSYTLRASW